MAVRCVAVAAYLLLLAALTSAKLVFPPGSDMGYIVPDSSQDLEIAQAMMPQVVDPQYNELREQLSRKVRRDDRSDPVQYSSLWLPHALRDTPKATLTGDSANALPREDSLDDDKHGIKMGVKDSRCDDAESNLLRDWDYSPANYTCYTPRLALPVTEADGSTLEPQLSCDVVPEDYMPQHHCMNATIEYPIRVPSYGDHRPLWPQFGEYKFVPPQRWLHNIEHGSIVMLYHPCTAPHLVQRLRALVTGCLYKHVITPYTPLTQQRPLALVAWGCVLEMATVDEERVKSFIRQRALHGPEGTLRKQGMFTEGLVVPSIVPDGKLDTDLVLCPDD